jgi:hypothetical protein
VSEFGFGFVWIPGWRNTHLSPVPDVPFLANRKNSKKEAFYVLSFFLLATDLGFLPLFYYYYLVLMKVDVVLGSIHTLLHRTALPVSQSMPCMVPQLHASHAGKKREGKAVRSFPIFSWFLHWYSTILSIANDRIAAARKHPRGRIQTLTDRVH